jgi:peroxiredoxin
MFPTVHQRNSSISFDEFRKQYKYVSVVYPEDGCSPCYPKFAEWNNKMDSISPPNNYTVLFNYHNGKFRRDRFLKRIK